MSSHLLPKAVWIAFRLLLWALFGIVLAIVGLWWFLRVGNFGPELWGGWMLLVAIATLVAWWLFSRWARPATLSVGVVGLGAMVYFGLDEAPFFPAQAAALLPALPSNNEVARALFLRWTVDAYWAQPDDWPKVPKGLIRSVSDERAMDRASLVE